MPGIVGIISWRDQSKCEVLVRAMVDALRTEDFFNSGTAFAPEVGVYAGWVAHAGSFAESQCLSEGIGNARLLFSGEWFPEMELPSQDREGEQRAGYPGINQLLHSYAAGGDCFLGKINGLFSGLLIDRNQGRALLFNDRYGIERIYYYEKKGITFFASEAKALLRVLPELRAFDDEGVVQFLALGCTQEGRTLFRGVRYMPGASVWTFERGKRNRSAVYFKPEEWESQTPLTQNEFEFELRETLNKVLPRYVSFGTSIGISLTGGLDTRMIMACLPSPSPQAVCYTFSGLTEGTLDAQLAAQVAKICGIEHQVIRIDTDFLSNFGDYVDRTILATDGCAGPLGAHEIFFNAKARDLSTIRVTGNFGSELLRSMSTFKALGLARSFVQPELWDAIDAQVRSVRQRGAHPVTFAAFREIPWNLFGALAAGRSQLTFRSPYLDNDIVALAFRAPQSSRQSPAAALRLVDRFNPKLAAIPSDRGVLMGEAPLQNLLRRIFAEFTFKLDYLHSEGMPNWLSPLEGLVATSANFGLLGLHKFLPYRVWFKRDLSPYVRAVLFDRRALELPFLNPDFVRSMAEEHEQGRRNLTREIHTVLTLEAVERTLIKGQSGSLDGYINDAV